jgi:hypothetical protein
MKRPFPATVLLFAASIWAQPNSQNEAVDARDLLRQVAETYRNLASFEWAAAFTVTTDSGAFQPLPAFLVGEFRRPRHMRIEFPKGPPIPLVEGTDGRTVWLYYPYRGYCHPDPKLFLQRPPHEAMSALDGRFRMSTSLTG